MIGQAPSACSEEWQPGVQLISAGVVPAARRRVLTVWSCERDVINGWNGTPHVDERLGRRLVGSGSNSSDVWRQRKRDADQGVLAKIA
jgi:hypothetical protein